ncbi:hypothetical protein [Nocardia sp. NPDC050710]|uniref:hypothetical protein n=1 Tax=Nocardia sp. NPDC050710 TaxID=3157220 RepID=UPI0034119B69
MAVVSKVLAGALVMSAAACGSVVEGNPVAGPQSTTTAPPAGVDAPLEEHAVDNECVLDAAEISALARVSLDDGSDTKTKRSDGSFGRSCTYYLTAGGILSFTASIKVMRPQQGAVTDAMIARRTEPGTCIIRGIGRAVLIEGQTEYPRAWIFTDKFVATIFLVGSNLPTPPTEDRWAAAARQIVAELPA